MTRRYDDTVEVRRRDEDPAEFLWRGRFYAVREVLAHWVETGLEAVERQQECGEIGGQRRALGACQAFRREDRTCEFTVADHTEREMLRRPSVPAWLRYGNWQVFL